MNAPEGGLHRQDEIPPGGLGGKPENVGGGLTELRYRCCSRPALRREYQPGKRLGRGSWSSSSLMIIFNGGGEPQGGLAGASGDGRVADWALSTRRWSGARTRCPFHVPGGWDVWRGRGGRHLTPAVMLPVSRRDGSRWLLVSVFGRPLNLVLCQCARC